MVKHRYFLGYPLITSQTRGHSLVETALNAMFWKALPLYLSPQKILIIYGVINLGKTYRYL